MVCWASLHQPRTHHLGGSIPLEDLHSTLETVHCCCLPWLQALLTLSHKYFALFNHSTCALSVPCHCSGLQGIHLATSSCSQKQLYSWKNPTLGLPHPWTGEGDCHPSCVQFQASLSYPGLYNQLSSDTPYPTGQVLGQAVSSTEFRLGLLLG